MSVNMAGNLINTRQELMKELSQEKRTPGDVFSIGMSLVMLAIAKDGSTVQESVDRMRNLFDEGGRKLAEQQLRNFWDTLRSEWPNVESR